jgi:hypothetical protein
MRRYPPGADKLRFDGWTLWRPVFVWGAVGAVVGFIGQFAGPKTGFLDLRLWVAVGLVLLVIGGLCLWRLFKVLHNERYAHLWRGHVWLLALGTFSAVPPLWMLIGLPLP